MSTFIFIKRKVQIIFDRLDVISRYLDEEALHVKEEIELAKMDLNKINDAIQDVEGEKAHN